MRYLSLFSGIGAFEKALENIDIDYELIGFSEIDKYAIKSYCAVHNVNEELNLGDISKIDLDKLSKNIDLITHGSPCQDFSIAGKLAGGDKGSGTRSSLMWCTVDIVEKTCPKYVIWENVKNLLSKKNKHNFENYLEIMDKLGYANYYQILNAKDYGIPQNRERVFTISIRKDINKKYIFPEKQELKLKLKDLLEEKVDEKYYLSDELLKKLSFTSEKETDIKVIGKINIKGHECIKRIYDTDGIAPTLTNMQGGNRQPKIIIDDTQGFDGIRLYNEYSPTLRASRSGLKVAVAMRGRYNSEGKVEQQIEISNREIANSITTVQKDSLVGEGLMIKEATKTGYKIAHEGDGVNISGRMKWQRGNVQKGMIQTLVTSGNERGVVVTDKDEDLLFMVFGLCGIINPKETQKYERSKEILRILWEEIGKKEIWQKIRRFYSVQEEEILQSDLHEKSISESRELSTIVPTGSSDCSEHIKKFIDRKKMLNMWEDWKTRYPSQRWELSEQQFNEFNLFMQELSYETTSNEISVYNMWKTDESFRLLQQALFEIQEIWGPIEDEIPHRLRIRKLSPLECWRLMGFTDEDFDKAKAVPTSDTQLYKQAGNSICVNVLERIFKNLL